MKKKKAIPWIEVKNKGDADLFFEFVEPSERKEFFEDLVSEDHPTISLPDFGKVIDVDIRNKVKNLKVDEIEPKTEEFIKRFIRDQKVKRPFLEYDDKKHKFVLKPKFDIEKMIKDIVNNNK